MSNKTKNNSVKETRKTTLIPKRRFPGFTEPWAYEPLSNVLKEHKIKNTAGRDVFSVSMEYGIVNQIELLGRSFAATDTSHYTIGRRFDVVYTKSPLKAFPYGVVKQCKFDGEVALSPLYGVFTPHNPHVGLMIEAYFESPNRSKDFLSPLCQKGAKNTLQITNTTFLSGRLPLPTQPLEQQKIAECLSSVDDLMAAQARKLDALKTHKKGLMQQLFPREGETQPSLRFPEFQNAGEWETRTMGSFASFSSGGTPSKDNPAYWNGSIPWISASSMYDLIIEKADHYVTPHAIGKGTRLAKKGSILILVRGSMLFKRVPICVAGIDVAFNQDVKALDVDTSVNNSFLLYQLSAFQSRIPINETGIGAGKIELEHLKGFELFFPEAPEQQRIAECLTNLDELITAEAQKLEALKAHKKGLMQQLFPSPQEAEV
jgi:type I restriction enzyme S subunit